MWGWKIFATCLTYLLISNFRSTFIGGHIAEITLLTYLSSSDVQFKCLSWLCLKDDMHGIFGC